MDGMAIDFTLTVVDTPGFGDTRGIQKDKDIEQQIRGIFDVKKGGIDHLDAVGFVVQSSAARLTQTQKYIFDSILSLFGQDIGENIFLLFTFADARKPQALSAVKEDGMPYQKCFKFNNSAIFDDVGDPTGAYDDDDDAEEDPTEENFVKLFWEIGMKSFGQFLASLRNICTKSLSLTRDVLQKREHLEKHVEDLHQQVTRGIQMFEQLREEENMLKKSLEDMVSSKEYKVMREDVKMEKEPLAGNTNTTTCLTCNFTCHDDCDIADDGKKKECIAMDQSKHPPSCGHCPNRCPWNKHVNLPYIFKYSTTNKQVTIDDIKERYEKATEEKLSKEQVISKVQDDIKAMEAQIKANLSEITVSLETLNKIALRTNHLSQLEYLDLVIQSEKDQGKHGWKRRVDVLLAFRNKAQVLYDIAQGQFDPFGQYREEADKARQENNNMQHLSSWLNVANSVKCCTRRASPKTDIQTTQNKCCTKPKYTAHSSHAAHSSHKTDTQSAHNTQSFCNTKPKRTAHPPHKPNIQSIHTQKPFCYTKPTSATHSLRNVLSSQNLNTQSSVSTCNPQTNISPKTTHSAQHTLNQSATRSQQEIRKPHTVVSTQTRHTQSGRSMQTDHSSQAIFTRRTQVTQHTESQYKHTQRTNQSPQTDVSTHTSNAHSTVSVNNTHSPQITCQPKITINGNTILLNADNTQSSNNTYTYSYCGNGVNVNITYG